MQVPPCSNSPEASWNFDPHPRSCPVARSPMPPPPLADFSFGNHAGVRTSGGLSVRRGGMHVLIWAWRARTETSILRRAMRASDFKSWD
eukprot:768566-Hanusia_phi.AAC.5